MKAIIFDFDGVIHDTFEIGYTIYERVHPGTSRELFRSLFDGNLFEKISETSTQNQRDEFKKLEYEAFKDLKTERHIRKELEILNKTFDLFIVSSNSARNLDLYFENCNFTDIFTDVLAAETHKSKIEKFKIVFRENSLNAQSCIFVTDTLGDILEAREVNIKTIAVDFGFHERERLEKGHPYKIISKFEDIRKVITDIQKEG